MSDTPGPSGGYVPITEDNKQDEEISFFIGYQNSTRILDGKSSAGMIR